MAYTFRQRKQNISYVDSKSPESDSIDSYPDYIRWNHRRPRSRRNLTLSSPTMKETKMTGSSVNLTARRRQGPTSKRAEGVQNKEVSDARHSSSRKRGSFSAEQPSSSLEKGSSSSEGFCSNKKTILSWLIDCNIIKEDELVGYMDGTKVSATKTGRITRGGILCICCQREFSVWSFEKHAGSDLGQPYEHIYLLKKGTCLLECQIVAWHDLRQQKCREIHSFIPKRTSRDKNDDACPICGDGGDLICCDKCPSTFHSNCMNMERVPQGEWSCPYCVCKFCGLSDESKQSITCSQCDKNFHWGCFKEFEKEGLKDALDLDCSRLYCGRSCREIYEKLESLVGVKNELNESYSWRVIRQMDRTPPAARHQHFENNSKVAVAWTLMDESFETIIDRYTGINVVRSVVYSIRSNLTRVNFGRFYTFILEKDDEVICAASVRVHGQRVAEMPFIATEEANRGKGFCGMLLALVELSLCELKVKTLIIPSIQETTAMWMLKFGFSDLSIELKRELTSYNILMFLHSSRLHKDLSFQEADSGQYLSPSLFSKRFNSLLSSPLLSPSKGGAESSKDEQTDNQNAQKSQKNPGERSLPDLNMTPPEE